MITKNQLNHEVYNDGVLEYGFMSPIYDKSNKKIGETFTTNSLYCFAELSKRNEDLELANSLGYSLDKKVKIPIRKISPNAKVKIEDEIYDIYKIDSDKLSTYLYLKLVIINDKRRNS